MDEVVKRGKIDAQLNEMVQNSIKDCLLKSNPNLILDLSVSHKEVRKGLPEIIAPVTNTIWNAGLKMG